MQREQIHVYCNILKFIKRSCPPIHSLLHYRHRTKRFGICSGEETAAGTSPDWASGEDEGTVDGTGDTTGSASGKEEGTGEADGEGDTDGEGEEYIEGEGDADGLGEMPGTRETAGEAVGVGVGLGEGEGDGRAEPLCV